MSKLLLSLAAAMLVGGITAGPALAQPAAPAPKVHHTPSCYDQAWESQSLNDCLANPGQLKNKRARDPQSFKRARDPQSFKRARDPQSFKRAQDPKRFKKAKDQLNPPQ